MSEDKKKNIEDFEEDIQNEDEHSIDSEDEDKNLDEDELSPNDQLENELLEEGNNSSIVKINIVNDMETAFLSYAMSVIVSRAIPDVRDGMKPVHRRILYAMHDLRITSDSPHKKSARIVGDVIGKYHPHGDTAVYEAMVRMAQNFSYRYPLVDGHGNFGSADGDGAAAMRYTEARMSKLSNEMLRDLNKNTVDFMPNYDGTENEPTVLPSRFPNLLVNGANGIAVGMATNIPPHNLNEVINGTLALIKNPNISIEELMEYIQAPDYPTGAYIMGLSDIKKAYLTGLGTVTLRAKVKVVSLKNGKKEIIVSEIPYQVSKPKVIERIADLHKDKIIEGITDLRDESGRAGMKIVIELKKDANVDVILNNLYKHTQLQTSYSVNMIALDHGQPRVLNLKQILELYVEHQIEVITRRTEFELEKVKNRLHIVKGLLVALANIDEVIKIIKSSKTTEIAAKELMSNFLLSEIQTKAILDMKLQRLTGLEVEKLQEEAANLEKAVIYLEEILHNHNKKMQVIVDELSEIQRKYGDERKSEINLTEDLEVEDEDLIPVEDQIITITNKGYIKRMTPDNYRVQKRGGKGITGAKMQDDDFVETMMFTSSHDTLLFFSNLGKVFSLKAYQIPGGSRVSKGLPIVNLLKFEEGETLATVINVKSMDEPGFIVFATKKGIIKKTELVQYKNIRSTGIRALLLANDDELIDVAKTNGTQDIIFGVSNGKAARFNESAVRTTNRAAAGVKAIQISKPDKAVGMAVVNSDNDEIIILTSNGYGKRTHAEEFKVKGRNVKGVKYMNITEKSGNPVCLTLSSPEDDLIVITDGGMVIRTHISDISLIGRDTQGVRIIKLNEGQSVASIIVVPRVEDETEEDFEDEVIEDNSDALSAIRTLDEIEEESEEEEFEEEESEE